MTQDPKKRPNWLGKNNNPSGPPPSEPPPSEPPSSAEDDGGDDELLPPWLRESASPVKRVTPPPKQGDTGGLPGWLSGAEPEEPKSYKVGGTELPSEYFAAGDELPDTLDTEMTFDSWMADQIEQRRVKDIEEEVPDLLSQIEEAEPAAPDATQEKGTGQLPEWFLGLEKLDTSAAPEWFVAEDTPARPFDTGMLRNPAPTSPEPTPEPDTDGDSGTPDWLNLMQPSEPEPEPEDEPSSSDFSDFMNSLGGTLNSTNQLQQDDEIDWYEQPQEADEDDASDTLNDDFFSQLVGKQPPAPPPLPQSGYDDLPDIGFEDEDVPAGGIEIPQNELDAFFDNVAQRSTDELDELRAAGTRMLDDFDEPELGWVSSHVEEVDDTPPAPPEPRAPEVPAADADDWLNQLNNIVSSATRPLRSLDDEDIPPELRDAWNSTPAAQSMRSSTTSDDEFNWGEAPSAVEYPVEEEIEEEAPHESEWLNAITADDELVMDDEPPAEQPTAASSLLAGRLRKDAPLTPEPEPEPEFEDVFEPPSVPDIFGEAAQAQDDEELIPASELQSGWLTDDVFGNPEAESETSETVEPQPVDESPTEDFFSMLQADADVNVLEDSTLIYDEQRSQADDALSEAEFMNTLGFESPSPQSTSENDFFAQAEQQAPQEDFFANLDFGDEDDEQPVTAPAPSSGWGEQENDEDDDFFARLGMDEESEAQTAAEQGVYDPYAPVDEEAEQPEDDFFASLGLEQSTAQGQYAPPQTDDFFASLGTEAQPAAAQTPQDEDFFASINFGDDDDSEQEADTYELPQTSELYGSFGFEEQPSSETPQEDDFFASLGLDDPTPRSIGEELPQEDDFFASLGVSDEVEAIPPAASEEDLFGQWGTQEELPADDDLFGEPSGINALPAASEEDLFGQWGTEQTEEEALTPADDFYRTFGMQRDEEPAFEQDPSGFDPYSQWDRPAETQPTDDFFTALDEMGDDPQADLPVTGEMGEELPQTGSFFASLYENDEPEQPESSAAFGDIDSYLASLGMQSVEEQIAAAEHEPPPTEIDFDALFGDAILPDTTAQKMDTIPGANEDWLSELGASVGEVSAGAMVRQKEDRPVEELPDRLRKLRQRAEEIAEESAQQPSDDALTPTLPGVPSALAPSTPYSGAVAEMTDDLILQPDQKQKVERLKALIPTVEEAPPPPFRMSAIDATYDTPFAGDFLEDSAESIVVPPKEMPPAPPTKKRRRLRPRQGPRLDRLLIAILLAAAVIVPFYVNSFRFGDPPPSSFAAGSRGQLAYNSINALSSGDLVLFGMEYSPTSAGELDVMTDVLLRHIFMQSAVPVIISSNPLGVLRSENLIERMNNDAGFLASIGATDPLELNKDFYVVSYLPGSTIGLRAFSEDSANMLLTDIHGQASNLIVRSLRDFALVALVADRAEDVRGYAEQIAPLSQAPMVAAVSYGAAPLAEPYAAALGDGLLVGFGDANTYANLLGYVSARPIAERTIFVPTLAPTNTPYPTATPLVSETPTQTPTRRASATPSPAPTATPAPLGSATIISRQSVNMRSGPGTDNDIITAVPSGAVVTALIYNDDQTWVQVRLEDGREGWISASLLSIRAQSAAPKANGFAKRQVIDTGDDPTPTRRASATRQATATPVPPTATRAASATPVPPTATETDVPATDVPATETDVPATDVETATEAPTATRHPATATRTPSPPPTETPSMTFTPSVTPIPAIASQIPNIPYRDERWYAVNMGILASVVVITVGAVINIVRGLLRRGRRG